MLQQSPRLSPVERREKQKLLLRDTATLCTLAGLVVALSFVTYGLFHSFSTHQLMLENRWRARGEAALAANRPIVALNDLHSALAYAPDDRGLQIELATALAASGRIQEAQVYFTTLLESEPGSGPINLQLARLAIRQNNAQAAIDHYEDAIDGTWQGDAFTRRRDIRLELSRFLIAQGRFPEARGLLLITSGNGPDNHPLQLLLGSLLEQANDPSDALDVYHKAALQRATRLLALEGEAHAAATLGRYAQAKSYLAQAMADPAFTHQPAPVRDQAKSQLETADGVLALFPSEQLPRTQRASRIAHAAQLAQARLVACALNPVKSDALGQTPGGTAPGAAGQDQSTDNTPDRAQQRTRLFATLGSHLQQLNPLAHKTPETPAPVAPPADAPPADPLAALAAQWTLMATGTTLQKQLAADPVFAQGTLQLAYQTERDTAALCGAPTGEDALLFKIAQAPDQVAVQP